MAERLTTNRDLETQLGGWRDATKMLLGSETGGPSVWMTTSCHFPDEQPGQPGNADH